MPSKIIIISAMSKGRVIGMNGGLPWRLGDDLSHFKKTTLGGAVVMGGATWIGLPFPALPGRRNIVLSRSFSGESEHVEICRSVSDVLRRVSRKDVLYVIGGANVYSQFIKIADEMILSLIDADVSGDAFFPEYRDEDWLSIKIAEYEKNSVNDFPFSIVRMVRK